ncbi:hypothetical protein SAMN06265365_1045 [Tistlia consotensis]|uniref:HdeA/HdeB family protein n=1 Tax=Tistlia consotensis USBA 355 TaxID=560819 RepID=A0A1Y6CHP6_9PROT|nr:hypothetical protein [Tistlia consotensis]SMF56497.1 hypothetical protein SAMN05428998_1216 [Tistlia consotensis USBA 355]SNR44667.1 hypothetical protein SAMN06265365_1045 [Tistlia consotensis]
MSKLKLLALAAASAATLATVPASAMVMDQVKAWQTDTPSYDSTHPLHMTCSAFEKQQKDYAPYIKARAERGSNDKFGYEEGGDRFVAVPVPAVIEGCKGPAPHYAWTLIETDPMAHKGHHAG